LRRSVYLTKHLPRLVEYLEQYPQGPALEVDSFLYWSAEQLKGRPIISATHVNILKSDSEELPEVLVASKQIFATHYLNGSLNITAMLWDRNQSRHYLVYVNRSRIDILDRWFGRMARTVIARRLENEAPEMLRGVRRRLESGEPPSSNEATPSREW
jgi:hypothetical protein